MARTVAFVRRVLGLLGLLIFLLLALAAAILIAAHMQYGRGEPYPNPSPAPVAPASALTPLLSLDFPPGNVARSADGRVFFNYHPFSRAQRFSQGTVFEVVDGKAEPYPDSGPLSGLAGVLGMTVDQQNRLWMVQPADLENRQTRLVAVDLSTRAVAVDHTFEPELSFIQDVRVAPDGKTAYLADTGLFGISPAALIVFDVQQRTARRVLEGHPSVSAQNWQIRPDGAAMTMFRGLIKFAAGVDGIAISHDGEWLYYAAMTHESLYRIRTADLNNQALDDAQLGKRVQRVGPKPLSDGIDVDPQGLVYITDVENGAVVRLAPDGELTTVVQSPDVLWADGIILTSDGEFLLTDSRLPAYLDPWLQPPQRDRLRSAGPYRIYGFAPPRDPTAPAQEVQASPEPM